MSKIISTTIINPNGKEDTCALVQVTGQELYYLLRPIEVIDRYTISFWIKAQANETVVVHYGEQTKSANVTTSWQRVIFSFTADHIDNVMLQFTTGNYYIYNTQLETGDVATDYNVSPEDIQAQLAQIETTMKTQYSEVVQALDSYKVEIGQNYATKESVNTDISKLTVDLQGFRTEASKTFTTKENFESSVNNLQQQIDGAIETFSGSVVPTLENKPAVNWSTDEIKDTHVGDLYVVNSEGGDNAGFYYRFEKGSIGYQWTLLKDSEITKALQDAKDANDKANALAKNLSENYSTTVQMQSKIDQSASGITQSVSAQITETKKYADIAASTAQSNADANTDEKLKSYSTTKTVEAKLQLKIDKDDNDRVVSMLNASANEINLKSNRFSLESNNTSITKDGVIITKQLNANGGALGGWDITEYGMSKETEAYIPPTDEHADRIRDYLLGILTLTEDELSYFDINGDGVVDLKDAYLVRNIARGVVNYSECTGAKKSSLKIEIDSTDGTQTIKFVGKNPLGENIESYMGVAQLKTLAVVGKSVFGKVVEGDVVKTRSGADLDEAYNKIVKSTYVDTAIEVTANSFAYKDITWNLNGGTLLGISYAIIAKGGHWESLASVSHQTIGGNGCRLIVAANVTATYTIRTYVYYQ